MNQYKESTGWAGSGTQAHDREGTAAFLPPGFDSLEEYLVSLRSFLASCEPFIDLMIVDYFTTNSWETRMPQDWKEAFESEQGKLSYLDLMELVSLGKLRDFKSGPSPSIDTKEGSSCPSLHTKLKNTVDHSHQPKDWPESLKDFVRMVKKHSINRTLDPDFTKFKDTLDIHLIPGMTPKKLHEVEILSGLIASYAKEHSIRSVIDLGAGQGYLSRVLAFQHQLCVLGVDSNTIQTCGAQTTQKRTERLFRNKTKQKGSGAGGKKGSASATKKSQPANEASVPPLSVESTEASGSDSPIVTTISLENGSPIPSKKAKTGSRSRSNSPADSIGRSGSSCKRSSRARRSKAKKEDNQNIPSSEINDPNIPGTPTLEAPIGPALASASTSTPTSTSTCTTATAPDTSAAGPIQQEQGQKKATIDSANDPNLATTPGSNFQLQHITHHITASTLPTLLKEHFPKKSKPVSCCGKNGIEEKKEEGEEEERWTLCGLHACGDLTSNMIKLYLESSATCLFSVGCCYHWITERYDKDGNIAISDGTHGFPLSAAFNRHKAHLGEHAKMTACQSPERWLKYQKETEDAIHGHYYRALLHKLMVENGLYPGPPAVAPVLGRMGKNRLKGFPHYLATAINRLRLPSDVIRPEDAQAAYDEYLEKDLYRIGILWALRTMLGPLFEGMILLDRATFLYENIIGDDGKGKSAKTSGGRGGSVQLVAGFDVVESPRNMILIALKN
ncbi:Methyltransferase-like protein 25 [Entomortierella chlamydospora]|uniref:Methyltransferase-like protein 25 n=1 Tax=Entomortierella chlamydospora TaxID=101097 RepID=A0A9P6T353_9FUNG|nr:Methyltransferase-like protein 25 [Entomortierella chlamydospora]KAG0021470.1 Methyltransferase-like protein 25 [Entomortierella chlamydospora]